MGFREAGAVGGHVLRDTAFREVDVCELGRGGQVQMAREHAPRPLHALLLARHRCISPKMPTHEDSQLGAALLCGREPVRVRVEEDAEDLLGIGGGEGDKIAKCLVVGREILFGKEERDGHDGDGGSGKGDGGEEGREFGARGCEDDFVMDGGRCGCRGELEDVSVCMNWVTRVQVFLYLHFIELFTVLDLGDWRPRLDRNVGALI